MYTSSQHCQFRGKDIYYQKHSSQQGIACKTETLKIIFEKSSGARTKDSLKNP